MKHGLTLCLILFSLAATAHAQTRLKIPAGKDRTLDILVRVPAPLARCMALSEAHKMLAVGHHAKHTANHVSLFRLDAAGKVQGEPVAIKLPRPAALARLPNNPTGLAFHPTQPLLYVWQDVVLPRTPQNTYVPLTPAEVAALDEIDHLLIFRLDDGKAKLLVSLCRGQAFGHGRPQGSVCIDAAGERLYVPNLRGDWKNLKNNGLIAGSYVLDTEGLPVIGKESQPAKPSDPKAIADAIKAGKPVLPQRVTPFNGEIAPDLPECSTGLGFVPLARDRVMFGGYHDLALATWTPEDRRVRLDLFQPPHGYRFHFAIGHPTLPFVYIAALNTPSFYGVEHVDGHMTMIPQGADLVGANAHSPPVVLGKHNLLVLGSHQRLLLVSLDAKGRIKPERTQVLIGNQYIEALAYSAKFDRLYVGVENAK